MLSTEDSNLQENNIQSIKFIILLSTKDKNLQQMLTKGKWPLSSNWLKVYSAKIDIQSMPTNFDKLLSTEKMQI